MTTNDLGDACVVPHRANTVDDARAWLSTDGAVIVPGADGPSAAMAIGAEVLGSHLVQLRRQFETTKQLDLRKADKVDGVPPDARGRRPYFYRPAQRMMPHNDGFGLGKLAPDHMFLWCERPSVAGGESFVIDGARLVELLAQQASTADLARFCWEADLDHSEPGEQLSDDGPVARRLASGRIQVRNHHNLTSKVGPTEESDAAMVRRWQEAVLSARDAGACFRMVAGDVLILDNYRVMHGRYAFDDDRRNVIAFWAWTEDALGVPSDEVAAAGTPELDRAIAPER